MTIVEAAEVGNAVRRVVEVPLVQRLGVTTEDELVRRGVGGGGRRYCARVGSRRGHVGRGETGVSLGFELANARERIIELRLRGSVGGNGAVGIRGPTIGRLSVRQAAQRQDAGSQDRWKDAVGRRAHG